MKIVCEGCGNLENVRTLTARYCTFACYTESRRAAPGCRGTYSCYTKHGCRSAQCREEARKYRTRHRRRVAGTLTPDDPRHGTENGYVNYSCRCGPCSAAKKPNHSKESNHT